MTRRQFSVPSVALFAFLVLSSSVAMAQGTPSKPADPHAGHTMPAPPAPTEQTAGAPVPPLTDEERAAAFPADLDGHTVHDNTLHYYVLVDQLEWQAGSGLQRLSWDTRSWIGGDLNRVWIHSEGSGDRKRIDDAEAHVMYGRSFARWWDVVAGIRQDYRPGPTQTWVAVGIKGLAPQWFEVDASLYVGEKGATLARIEVEYELLVTNRVVLQPLVELNVYGKAIPERGIGAGLSSADAGLRLRYEIRREFAPYIGVLWHRQFAGTADYARAAGEDVGGWRATAGLRMWF